MASNLGGGQSQIKLKGRFSGTGDGSLRSTKTEIMPVGQERMQKIPVGTDKMIDLAARRRGQMPADDARRDTSEIAKEVGATLKSTVPTQKAAYKRNTPNAVQARSRPTNNARKRLRNNNMPGQTAIRRRLQQGGTNSRANRKNERANKLQ